MFDLPHNPVGPAALARARARYGPDLIDRFLAARGEGDPAADRLAAAFARLPGGAGWRMLDRALADGAGAVPGAPAALGELLAPLADPPRWLDLELADRGAVAFWRVGSPTLALTMIYGSLAFGYRSAELVRPLAATGRLERMAARRLSETTRWTVAVTEPGGMHPGAAGWRSSVRVRLVHALVRAHLRESPAWDAAAWGVPINALGGLATAIGGFHVIPLRAMRDLGVRFSAGEEEAMAHLWRWVAFVMGVPEDLLPRSAADARHRVDATLALDPGPNEDSARLMHALLHHGLDLDRMLPGSLARPAETTSAAILGAFVRRWMGAEMADRLGVPERRLERLIPLMRGLARARDAARATGVLGSDARLAEREIAAVRRLLALRGAPDEPLAPGDAAERPVLAAA